MLSLVTPKAGLCEVRAIGSDVRSNSQGTQIRLTFDDMSTQLAGVYGRHEVMDRLMPGSIWRDPQDWMMALLKKERVLQAEWDKELGADLKNGVQSIILAAHASDTSRGYLLLQYESENNPQCEAEVLDAQRTAL